MSRTMVTQASYLKAKVARESKPELCEVLAEMDSHLLLLYVKGPHFSARAQERL